MNEIILAILLATPSISTNDIILLESQENDIIIISVTD